MLTDRCRTNGRASGNSRSHPGCMSQSWHENETSDGLEIEAWAMKIAWPVQCSAVGSLPVLSDWPGSAAAFADDVFVPVLA